VIRYILLCLILVLDICCDTTNIYKLSEMLCRKRGVSNNLDNIQIYKILFSLHSVCFAILPSILQFATLSAFCLYFLNKWMNFLFLWTLAKVKLPCSTCKSSLSFRSKTTNAYQTTCFYVMPNNC
jgi:hypothetical protein